MSLTDDFPTKIVDQEAETSDELMEHWPMCYSSFYDFARKKVNSGQWEKVWKRVNGRMTPAYRRSAKRKAH